MKKLSCLLSEFIPRIGGSYCPSKPLVRFILKRKGFNIDPLTFDKEALNLLIAQDKIVGPFDFFSVEDNDQESDFATSVNKTRTQTIPGTKGFRFMFNKGNCFQNEINKLDNSSNYEFVPIFQDGGALWAVNSDGTVKGFDANLFVMVFKVQTSADVAGSTLEIDITPKGMGAWQGGSGMYEGVEFGFDEINPVAGLNIELPILTAGATTTTVKITELCADSAVSGLTSIANWKMERNGVLENVTGTITEVNGKYTFTHGALAANDKVRFMTMSAGYPVYVLDTNYYSGSSAIETVV